MKRTGIIRAAAWVWLCAAAFAGPAEDTFQGAWQWPLPPRKYGKLSQSERLQFEGAERLIREGKYEAAALEFDKFLTANPKTSAYAHGLLLQGYGYHLGRFRNKAIERYNEVLDFFDESVDEAVPAAYLKGLALVENGNLDQGVAVWQAMSDRDANLAHPVADLALNRLADHYVSREQWREAERAWTRVVDGFLNDFYGKPEAAATAARLKLTDLYCRDGRLADAETLLDRYPLAGKKPVDHVVFIHDRGLAVFGSMTDKVKRSFFDWARGRRNAYAEGDRTADWQSRVLSLAVRCGFRREWGETWALTLADFRKAEGRDAVSRPASWMTARLVEADAGTFKPTAEWKAFGEALADRIGKLNPPDQLAATLSTLGAFPALVPDGSDMAAVWNATISRGRDLYLKMMNPERDNGLSGLTDRLRNARYFDRASELAQRIEAPALAMWKEIEILGAQSRWADQAKKCEELEQLEDATFSLRALRLRAQLYKDRLQRYEDAIKLYAMINEPPGTIWAMVDCYQRWGKPEKAEESLTEIENFFERDAPQAALRKAQVWEHAKNQDKTVAALRAVLRRYPKHSVSSQAHQWLERYGVATGGGMTDHDL